MDFLRHPVFFRLDETTVGQRRSIMRDFIARVRAVLDEKPFGRKRWLCVRIPCYMALYDEIGIDPASWAAAGVEMFNISPHYFTVQQTDLAKVRAQVPNAFIYQEMCHSIWNGKRVGKGYDAFTFRRATREQYLTTAHLAYEQGADGVSLFNFVYYREHGNGDRGPFAEPPFDVLDHLGNPAWLARQPQHWFVATGWNPKPDAVKIPIPRKIAIDSAMRFELQLSTPSGGWRGVAKLRIQADASLENGIFAATLNGERLEETADRSEPYPNPYPSLLGAMEEMRAWNVPAHALKNGINELLLTVSGKVGNARIVYLDLAARGAMA
jgi:hypothetical protein